MGISSRRKFPTINWILIGINIVYFIYIEISGSSEDVYHMIQKGALYTPLMIKNKEYWRLFTAMFMHFGLAHIGNNMFMLFILGDNLERALGKIKYVILYILAGVVANIASVFFDLFETNPPVSAGASGAIFGVVGALLWIVIANKGRFEDLSTRQMTILLVLSLYFGFTSSGVDNVAHVVGTISGFILCIILYRKKKSQSYNEGQLYET